MSARSRAVEFFVATVLAVGIVMLPVRPISAETDTNTGSIHGQITISRKLTSQRMRFRLYPGFKPQAPPSAADISDDERRNVVVYLEKSPLMAMEFNSGKPPEIRQLGETFIPHVLPIVKGTTVEFPNEDPIFHNVFSLSGTQIFDLGRYPQGDSRSVTFSQAGIVPVFCHLHSNMSAIVLVLDNPFFNVPDAEGAYIIDGVVEGTYTLVGWHERSEPVVQQVTVRAGESIELNIVIPIEDEGFSGQ